MISVPQVDNVEKQREIERITTMLTTTQDTAEKMRQKAAEVILLYNKINIYNTTFFSTLAIGPIRVWSCRALFFLLKRKYNIS